MSKRYEKRDLNLLFEWSYKYVDLLNHITTQVKDIDNQNLIYTKEGKLRTNIENALDLIKKLNNSNAVGRLKKTAKRENIETLKFLGNTEGDSFVQFMDNLMRLVLKQQSDDLQVPEGNLRPGLAAVVIDNAKVAYLENKPLIKDHAGEAVHEYPSVREMLNELADTISMNRNVIYRTI